MTLEDHQAQRRLRKREVKTVQPDQLLYRRMTRAWASPVLGAGMEVMMHAVSAFVLVVACASTGLVLAALGAGLVIEVVGRSDAMDRRSSIDRDRFDMPASPPSHCAGRGGSLVAHHRIGATSAFAPIPSLPTGPPKSPLYPQNGVTLWDRIRVSSKRDRRAFLLGTAIQVHAPDYAATPGPRSDPQPCCPRT